jgi:sugar lactone lactonase YvrE
MSDKATWDLRCQGREPRAQEKVESKMAHTTAVLADGIYFGEGPRWREGRLWFSDQFAHGVKSVSLAGDVRTEFEIDDRPSGLGWMPDGSMLIVSMMKRQILRRTSDGAIRVHADLNHIADFHCNDMVVDPAGRAFVGNFGFDLDAELASRGVESVIAEHATANIACVLPDGTTRVAAPGMHFPNGSVITPDGKTLIVAETLAGALTAFDLADDGTLSNRRPWASTWPRVPDGITLDAEGGIWFANPGAPECVRMAQGGEVLDTIDTGQLCYSCMLGGTDGRTLFMLTAATSDAHQAVVTPTGKLLTAGVDIPHAGRP